MDTTSENSHEQFLEQNKLLGAQIRLLQANCQWLSSYNSSRCDLWSSRADDDSCNISSNECEGFLDEYYSTAAGINSTCEVLAPTLNCGNIHAKDLSYYNELWPQPFHVESFPFRDNSLNVAPPSARQMSELPVLSSDFWFDDFTGLSDACAEAQAGDSSDLSTIADLLTSEPPNIIDSVTESSLQSISNGSSSSQNPLSEQGVNSDSHTTSITFPIQAPQWLTTWNHMPPRQPQWRPDVQQYLDMSRPEGFLDHYIFTLRDYMQRLNAGGSLSPKLRQKLMAKGVLWVIQEAWPQAGPFWKMTTSCQGFLQAELWRNFPESSVYDSMHPSYRPTVVQLVVPHAPIIDWLPWPDLRDKIILSQEQIDVDFVCKTAIHNVVAHRRAVCHARTHKRRRRDNNDDSANPPRDLNKTSFRVWDLCLLEETTRKESKGTTTLTYRPKSAPVRALEKAYTLEYDDFQTQKLHPDFFNVFPNLFAPSVVSDYIVQDLQTLRKGSDQDVLGTPQPMSAASLERLEAIRT